MIQPRQLDHGRARRFSRQRRRWRERWLAGLAGVVVLLLSNCSRTVEPQPFAAIAHEFSPDPARVGPSAVTFKLSDVAGNAITGARIAIEADMSHPGMSPIFTEAKEDAPGRYRAHLQFSMAGDWVILLHVTLPGGKKLERQIDVGAVRPN